VAVDLTAIGVPKLDPCEDWPGPDMNRASQEAPIA
jgi:hypothetical protein